MPEFVLPPLGFSLDSLAPAMSRETLEYHYGKHHQGYISNLNTLVKGSIFEGKSLKEIVKTAQGAVFDNAAQAFNHSFFWKSLTPNGGGEPGEKLMAAIVASKGLRRLSLPPRWRASEAVGFGSCTSPRALLKLFRRPMPEHP